MLPPRSPGMAKVASVVRDKIKKPTPASAVGTASNVVPGSLPGAAGPQSLDANRDAWANALDTMGQVYTPDPLTAVAKVAGMGLAGYGQGKATRAKEEGSNAYRAKLAKALSGEVGNDDLMGLMNDPYADDKSQAMLWNIWQQNNPSADELQQRQLRDLQIQQGQLTMQQQQDEARRQQAIRGGQMDAVTGFMDQHQAAGGDLFSPEMQADLRAQGIAGVDPQDTRRYEAMQPYAAAGDFENAFQQYAAQPQASNEAPKIEKFRDVDPQTGEPVEVTMQWMNGGWQEIGRGPAFNPNAGVKVDNRQMGNVPPGYIVEYDDQDRPVRMVPIPGGPAAAEAEKAGNVADAQQNKRMTMTDTVTGAADAARKLVDMTSTGLIGQGMSYFGQTDAAEVYRQTDVLKSTATIENLNAMRRESPTGGALGNVTEKEGAMLAAAAGALDPASGPERFAEQLDNYELTLMRVIHGYDAGTRMFEQRKAQRPAQAREGQQGVDAGVTELPQDDAQADAMYEQLPSGSLFRAPDGSIRRKP